MAILFQVFSRITVTGAVTVGVVALGVGTVFGTYLRGLEAGMHESEALLWFCNDGLNASVNCAVSKWSRVSLGHSA
ncbi:hypothetical protein VNO77_33973 [Canavalia gladiata]|uniref:Uncharacterized protein n=1 Tax=Canavalia gladiata TaxID=3824 RepID=A0AAN9PY68_CANGL